MGPGIMIGFQTALLNSHLLLVHLLGKEVIIFVFIVVSVK